ncbi:MAG TPA: MarR family transcriptional regulator [Aestuariivirgaceae bacterium]
MARKRKGNAPQSARRSLWALFLKAHAQVARAIEEELRKNGLPELEWYDVLWALEQAPQQRLRMHELAKATVITRSNMTRLVDRLEADGLLNRNRNCEDRRGAYAVLTPEGRRRRQEIWQVYGMAIAALFERHVTGAEARAMEAALERILDSLHRNRDQRIEGRLH